MGFLTEPEPERGRAHPIAPGIRRIVAPNPGPMTYWGTNTYLIDSPQGTTVLDPGPDDPTHVAAILAAAPSIAAILLSHTHHDHLGATAALKAATAAPVHAWHDPASPGFNPDHPLQDTQHVGPWQALHTPGHAEDHLCFAGPGGIIFSADHVMTWSSSVVAAAPGSMANYMNSLRRLLARGDTLLLPGHGPPMTRPASFIRALLAHRVMRENAIVAAVSTTAHTVHAIAERLYPTVPPALRRAAERNVSAHLQKLADEARVHETSAGWAARD